MAGASLVLKADTDMGIMVMSAIPTEGTVMAPPATRGMGMGMRVVMDIISMVIMVTMAMSCTAATMLHRT
jgi:hypothetical protein